MRMFRLPGKSHLSDGPIDISTLSLHRDEIHRGVYTVRHCLPQRVVVSEVPRQQLAVAPKWRRREERSLRLMLMQEVGPSHGWEMMRLIEDQKIKEIRWWLRDRLV